MKRRLICLGVMLTVVVLAHAQEGSKRVSGSVLIAFAREYQIEMLVGQYDPAKKRWLDDKHAFTPPEVGTPFTLFGVNGKLAQVSLDHPHQSPREDQPWDWSVDISSWNRSVTHVALALSGEWPDLTRHPQLLSPTDVEARQAVTNFLKAHKLDVPNPRITEAWRVDLDGDGQDETLVCANVDPATVQDDAPAAVYSVALVLSRAKDQWQTLPLRAVTSYKPAHQSAEEHQRRHGRFAVFQVLALADPARDGHIEVAILNDNRMEGPEVDLFALQDGKIQSLLSARKIYL